MCFHRAFRLSEVRPRKHRKAYVNRGGVEGVVRSCKSIQDRCVILIQRLCPLDERLCECLIHSQVPLLVGIAERGELEGVGESQMVEFPWMGIEAQHDAAHAFSVCQLSKAQSQELLPAGKRFHVAIPLVRRNTLLELVARQNRGDLTEDERAGIHTKSGEGWPDLP